MKQYMNGDDTIDKLFKERLEEDAPAFKEEYWKNFESRLDGIPPQAAPAATGSLSKILSGFTLTKGILLITGLAVITAAVYFISENKDADVMNTPAVQVTPPSPTMTREVNIQSGYANETQKGESSKGILSTDTRKEVSLQQAQTRIDKKETANQGFTYSMAGLFETKPSDNNRSISKSSTEEPLVQGDVVTPADNLESQPEEKYTLGSENKDNKIRATSHDTVLSEADRIADSAYNAIQALQPENNKQSVTKAGAALVKEKRLGFYLSPGASLYSTFGNAEGFERKTMAAFQFGGGLEYRINDAFSIYAEINALRLKGFELSESSGSSDIFFYTWINKVTVQSREFTLVQVPLMFAYHTSKHNISLGPVFRYVVSSAGEKVVKDTTPYYLNYYNSKAENFLAGINRFQLGMALEYSLNFYRQHAILIRYNLMFGDFNRNSYYSGLSGKKVNSLLVAVRFRIY